MPNKRERGCYYIYIVPIHLLLSLYIIIIIYKGGFFYFLFGVWLIWRKNEYIPAEAVCFPISAVYSEISVGYWDMKRMNGMNFVVKRKIIEGKFGGVVKKHYLCIRKLRGLCPCMMFCVAEPY